MNTEHLNPEQMSTVVHPCTTVDCEFFAKQKTSLSTWKNRHPGRC
ncbi:MAG: hypothetical protein ACTTH8_06890 [Treponema sp.]